MKRVIGLFFEREDAANAIADLEAAGFTADEVGVLLRKEDVADAVEDERGAAVESAGAGAVGGGALGGLIGLIAGASVLVVPGVGPALAAGALATVIGSTAAGAGIGATYGGFIGALIGFGVAEEQTDIYVDGVQQGGVLILVRADGHERLATAERVMLENNGSGVDVVEEPEAG